MGCFESVYQSAAVVLRCDGHEEIISIVVPYGQFQSRISQADANQQALAFAEDNQVCPWWNTEQVARCDMGHGAHDFETEVLGPGFEFNGGSGAWPNFSSDIYAFPADTVPSYISQADANQRALALAENALTCTGPLLPLRVFWFMEEYGADSCEEYPVGGLIYLYGGYGWVDSVVFFIPIDYLTGNDNAEHYPPGALTEATLGDDWAGYGALISFD